MDRPRNARIAGIAIYAVLALILLPLLFSDPVDPRTTIRSRFAQDDRPPVIPGGSTVTSRLREVTATPAPVLPQQARRELPVGNPGQTARATPPENASVRITPRPQTQPTRRPVAPTTTTAPAAGNANKAVSAKAGQSVWRLQLASYTDQDSAERFVKRLRDDGLQPQVIGAQSGSRRVWRVSVEFPATRAEANALKRKLDKRYRVNGLLQQSG